MCLYFLYWALWLRFHDRYWYQSFIDGSNIWGVDRTDPKGPEMDHPPLGRNYLVVVTSYDMSCALIFLNGIQWVRFHGRYWYQSFIDGSNIRGVDRTDHWGPETDHPPLGRSYLVVVPLYDMSCALIFIYGILWVRFHGRYWYQFFIDGSNIWGVDRIDPWSPAKDHAALGHCFLVVVSPCDMSCTLILLTGLYGWDFMTDIDINPSSMGLIFGVWIGPTLGVPKWTIRHWAAAIWFGSPSIESNIAAKFSSAAAKINCGYNILAAKYFAAALQRKKLTFFTIPIYIFIYIYINWPLVRQITLGLIYHILLIICLYRPLKTITFIGFKFQTRKSRVLYA